VETGLVLEPSDPRLKFSWVIAVLQWWILGHTRTVRRFVDLLLLP
jgi:hypothetical protein